MSIGLDNGHSFCYNAEETTGKEKAHPIIRAWIGQLLNSKELDQVLRRYPDHQLDVTLSATRGRAVLNPKISIRYKEPSYLR